MIHSQTVRSLSILMLFSVISQSATAGGWPKLLDRPRAGTNTIALVNADALRLGAAKLKVYKNGEQKAGAANLVAELPEHVKLAALSAFLDLDTLDPIWEMGTLTFEKNKLPTPKGIAEHEGGYLDHVAGKIVVWSPRNRYILLQNADRLTINQPADRPAVANWLRSLSKPAQVLPDYLKHAAETAPDGTALLIAIDMADTVSPVSAKEKLATAESLAESKINLEALAALVGELRGVTFSVDMEEQFQGRLQFDFSAAPTLLSKVGKALILEVFARRGILLPEMNGWEAHLEGKALVLSGPLNAMTIVSLLSFFASNPSADTTPDESPASAASTTEETKKAQASKRYFTSVTRVIEETRNVKGVSVAEHGVWNDRLSRKIDQLPLLNVDKDLLDYGANVAQLIRGAGLTIKNVNMAAGAQKLPQRTGYAYAGYGYAGYSINDNSAYNMTLNRQARAAGMTQHLGNLAQIDNLTGEIRRVMTERYKVEF